MLIEESMATSQVRGVLASWLQSARNSKRLLMDFTVVPCAFSISAYDVLGSLLMTMMTIDDELLTS